tara:strand:+ start:457 stop:762 length:306 start_codon:yes stop_codon:yes gene_type:complete
MSSWIKIIYDFDPQPILYLTCKLYQLSTIAKAPRPARVAKTFKDFVNNVCLGSTMKRLQIRKIPANPDRAPEEMEEDYDSEEETDDDKPAQTFKPFPKPAY